MDEHDTEAFVRSVPLHDLWGDCAALAAGSGSGPAQVAPQVKYNSLHLPQCQILLPFVHQHNTCQACCSCVLLFLLEQAFHAAMGCNIILQSTTALRFVFLAVCSPPISIMSHNVKPTNIYLQFVAH